MKKTLFFVLALAAICTMSSCKKNTIKDKVVFGDSKGMTVTSYEGIPLVEQYGHFSWGYYVDLNNDGQGDVQFHSTSEIMEGGILTELHCLDNTAVLGELNDQKFTLLANNANDSFDSNSTFMSTKVALLRNENCCFPKDEAKYIGFKITESDKSRLGWMKVILHHDHVELLETAIQK
ncbi:MAG: hypothetical protein K6G25_05565 [Bacteroidales bacterium]|nr:hypothetical protein [Bacteroidales bacterium]